MRTGTGVTARSTGQNSSRCSPATARAIVTEWPRAARRTTKAPGCARRQLAMPQSARSVELHKRQSREIAMATPNTPLWEVFIRSRNGLAHKHVGSLHASDATMALQAARAIYTRRGERPPEGLAARRGFLPPSRRRSFDLGRAVDGDHRKRSRRQGHDVRAGGI